MTVHLTSVQIMAAVGALLVLIVVWRASARVTRRTAAAARGSVRLVSLAGRVVMTASAIVIVQWIVIEHAATSPLLFGVLGLPALFAAHTLTRALTVTTLDDSQRRSRQ